MYVDKKSKHKIKAKSSLINLSVLLVVNSEDLHPE